MWNLKYGTNEPIYKIETSSDRENRLVIAKGVWGGSGMEWEFGVSTGKLLYLKWVSNEVLLCSIGNYI